MLPMASVECMLCKTDNVVQYSTNKYRGCIDPAPTRCMYYSTVVRLLVRTVVLIPDTALYYTVVFYLCRKTVEN
jgi:hypothetical protein